MLRPQRLKWWGREREKKKQTNSNSARAHKRLKKKTYRTFSDHTATIKQKVKIKKGGESGIGEKGRIARTHDELQWQFDANAGLQQEKNRLYVTSIHRSSKREPSHVFFFFY